MKNITEGKLIKTEFGFKLNDLDGVYVASVQTGSLSLENCEAIKRGYDLDELARQEAEKIHIKSSHEDWGIWEELVRDDARSIRIGMEKIIELLGDKKFSDGELENIIVKSWYKGAEESYKGLTMVSDDDVKELIQSVQQTEWDVIIETTCDGLVTGLCMPEVCDCNIIPKRDSKGKMILKIKK